MKEAPWKLDLAQRSKAALGDSAQAIASRSLGALEDALAPRLRQHQELAWDTFDAIMLCLSRSVESGTASVAKQVSRQLLAQIAQDIAAICRLTALGFAYQAASVSASTFEHSWMLASIGADDRRAQRWMDHVNAKQNIDSVRDRVNAGLDKLDAKNPGLKGQLGDPYEGMYQALCLFKHGNPMVQRRIVPSERIATDALGVLPTADRRALIAACWAIEGAIRAGWIGLVSFLGEHGCEADEWRDIVNGINRSANGLKAVRAKIEAQT